MPPEHTSKRFTRVDVRRAFARPESRPAAVRRTRRRVFGMALALAVGLCARVTRAQEPDAARPVPAEFRKPATQTELRDWLENMIVYHRFTEAEVSRVTGLSSEEVRRAVNRFGLAGREPSLRAQDAPLLILPYPGGRHPRIGFLDGAIRPQRETKFSVFTPWNPTNYIVVDLPEAIWSNLGLTYLAHTHIPTIWDQQGIQLDRLEWNRRADGTLDFERVLPNGLTFGARVAPATRAVAMELWLRNGTTRKLTKLRAQVCVMFKGAPALAAQTHDNKLLRSPYAACRSNDGRRWIITAWQPLDRVWENPPVPCLHSDPAFPDCAPGETVRARGWLWFYEGGDIEGELDRLKSSGGPPGPSSPR